MCVHVITNTKQQWLRDRGRSELVHPTYKHRPTEPLSACKMGTLVPIFKEETGTQRGSAIFPRSYSCQRAAGHTDCSAKRDQKKRRKKKKEKGELRLTETRNTAKYTDPRDIKSSVCTCARRQHGKRWLSLLTCRGIYAQSAA